MLIRKDSQGAGAILYRGKQVADLLPAQLPSGLTEISIIGSGPSLRSQHPERLAPRSAILLNGAISLADRLPPLAIAVEDERFVWRHFEMLLQAPKDCIWMLSPGAIRALLSIDSRALDERDVLLIDNILKPVQAPRRGISDPEIANVVQQGNGAALSLAPARGIVPAGTVAYSALQFALAASPGRIGLAGIDLSNANAPRFYETEGQAAASGIVTGLERILAGFSLARTVAEASGIALACYSPVSALLKIGYPLDRRLD